MIRGSILFLFFASFLFAQSIYTQKDVEVCNATFQLAVEKGLQEKPISEIVIEIAKSFLGLDYEAQTLEKGDKEKLVVHLTGLDCYTFLETSLVFARCIKAGDTSFTAFQNELESVRYRNGKLKDYPSRLHYFSDWIYEMDKREVAKNVTKEIGGVPYKKVVNFMSTHPDSYRQLREIPAFIEDIKQTEKEITSRDYYYIPEDDIELIEEKIQSGDILGITTNIDGLDISHTGIAIRLDDGRIHLLHAPTVGKKVQISEESLADYIKAKKFQTGIMIVRPLWNNKSN